MSARLSIIGRRDRLPVVCSARWQRRAGHGGGRGLRLRVAIDYSAREAIPERPPPGPPTDPDARRVGRLLAAIDHGEPAPEVDLLIRTGGDQRLSDFLLWECAYAELYLHHPHVAGL